MTAHLFPMPASHFQAWLAEAETSFGWNDAECARRLGVQQTQIWRWKNNGAPGYVRLAITALMAGSTLWFPKKV